MRQFFPKTFDFTKTPPPTPFPILYDKDQAVSKMLGLFTTNWDESAVDQNVPTVFLLNESGEIVFKYRSQITFDRPNADYLVKIMDKLVLNK
jgi:peroxiredoxin